MKEDWIVQSLKNATLCGISPLDFWEMTPLEIGFIADAYAQNKKTQSEELISVAYVQAMWTIQWLGKKHPKPLKEILKSTTKQNKTMTSEDMLNQVKQLNAMFGGEIINGK